MCGGGLNSLQPASAEIVWYHSEAAGEMGIRSNFGSFERRMSGLYGTNVTTEIDGRALAAASRYKRVHAALKQLPAGHARTLAAWAHHRLLGVMLASKVAQEMHTRAKTTRNLADWVQRLAKTQPRSWYQIRVAAVNEAERALVEFDKRWRRHR